MFTVWLPPMFNVRLAPLIAGTAALLLLDAAAAELPLGKLNGIDSGVMLPLTRPEAPLTLCPMPGRASPLIEVFPDSVIEPLDAIDPYGPFVTAPDDDQ